MSLRKREAVIKSVKGSLMSFVGKICEMGFKPGKKEEGLNDKEG